MAEKPRECRARATGVRALTPDILEADLAMVEPPALAYDAELRGLARQHARFAYHPVTPSDGEPAAVADRLVDDVTGLIAYVAGGETTIKAVRAALMAKGMERKAVKWEKFW